MWGPFMEDITVNYDECSEEKTNEEKSNPKKA